MAKRAFGVEIEYPLVAFDAAGKRVSTELALSRFFSIARESLETMRDTESGGVFLSNGSRLYPDCGKVEWASPEVTTPDDLCRHVIASGRQLGQIAQRLIDSNVREAYLGRHNVGYRPVPTTWACHASIGCTSAPERMPAFLIPHLVSRVVYSGAGGFDGFHPGARFLISPRVAHVTETTSHTSTHDRGIFHLKNEPLCRGFSRLHILVGECGCSQTSLWLTHATTVLVAAVFDAGLRSKHIIRLRSPLDAIGQFAADTTCRLTVPDESGRMWSALEIQEHYLKLVVSHLGDSKLPEWAESACQRWRAILDGLRNGVDTASLTLDWAIKLGIFRRFAERQGMTWEEVEHWNAICKDLSNSVDIGLEDCVPVHLTRDILATASPLRPTVDRLTPRLEQCGLSWDQFPQFLELQQQLFELDARYGELTDRGLFNALDAQGVLEHRIESIQRIDEASASPPPDTRAALRGRLIKERNGQPQFGCNWSAIYDSATQRYLDMSDPFAPAETWIERTIPHRPFEQYLERLRRNLIG